MILSIIALSLFVGAQNAAEYTKDQTNAAYVAAIWNNSESSQYVGYPVRVKFFSDIDNNINHSRISVFSPGLLKVKKTNEQSISLVEAFHRFNERKTPGWLPGDFFIFDPESSGKGPWDSSKSVSFGQGKEAFAFIYTLNKLYNEGIQEFTIHAQCYGTRRIEEALYYLSNNEQTQKVEDFFLSSGSIGNTIDRIRRMELLAAIQCFSFQTPLRKAIDGPISIGNSKIAVNINKGLAIAGGAILLSQLLNSRVEVNQNLVSLGAGLFIIPKILRSLNMSFKCDEYLVKNYFLPLVYSYDNTTISEEEMRQKIQYLKDEIPHWAFFMTTAKDDQVIGNWNVAEFFESFPVAPDRKYLIPSPQFGHCKFTQQQIMAKNAFLRRYGSSYYKFPDGKLNQGHRTLDFAQKGQSTNIKEYIQYMESDDNEF